MKRLVLIMTAAVLLAFPAVPLVSATGSEATTIAALPGDTTEQPEPDCGLQECQETTDTSWGG
ncbi:hypothetical protein ACFWCB_30345 [Streptomyces sp. NPDC060048]|uniref:hypothetical protein n=1 Tax=unclassified Streptomyces TaxID=2593676 RepID=UPI0036B5C175